MLNIENHSQPITWKDISTQDKITLKREINAEPRLHIDNLVREISKNNLSTSNNCINTKNAEKLHMVIKDIPLETPLLVKIYNALCYAGILDFNSAVATLRNQSIIVVSLDKLLIDCMQIWQHIENLSKIDSPNGMHERLATISMLTTHFNDSREDILVLCRNNWIQTLQEKSPNSNLLFRLLCKNANKNDTSLYQAIQTLLEQHLEGCTTIGIDHVNGWLRTPIDDFLANNGNMAILLSGVDQNLLSHWASQFIGYNNDQISKIPSADLVIALYVPKVKYALLANANDLDFLKSSHLMALGQYLEVTIPTSDENSPTAKAFLNNWVPFLKRLNNNQQQTFLGSLSSYSRGLLTTAYVAHFEELECTPAATQYSRLGQLTFNRK